MALTPSTMLALGTRAPDFDLPDVVSGESVRRSDFEGRPLLVMFICNHCPYVKLLKESLADTGKAYLEKGVGIVAISSNDAIKYPDDSPAAMKADAERYGYPFPYLYDESQDVARAYQAACTPDLYLFDAAHRLVYRGQYDDARPGNAITPTGKDLKGALDAVLEGKPVTEDQKPATGCNIKWRK